ncbi:MAG: efflux RND transporter periplasmic adaptor subunit [Gemmatimonadota bacterium]
MRKGTKIGIAAGLVVLVGGIAVIGAVTGNDAVAVRMEEVTRQDLVGVVSASGWIQPHRKVDVQADIMGRITALYVAEGQSVTAGQILLRIDPTQYEAAVSRAEAAVSEARARQAQASANLIQAQRVWERNQQLASANAELVSRQALEESETQVLVNEQLLKAATFGVAQAQAALGEARNQLAKSVIRAPMDGIVTRLNVDAGETAIVGTMNNAGSLLLTVSDLSVMEVVVHVDETDVPQLELGDSAVVQIDAFPRQKFTGRVSEIGHSAVRSRETAASTGGGQGQAIDFQVVIRLDSPPATLRPDLSATSEMVTDMRPRALAVPIIALTVRERDDVEALPNEDLGAAALGADAEEERDQEGVFVVRDGKAHFTPVRIGIAGREHFEVLAGLEEGDTVVAGPYEAIRTLEHEQAVRALPADTAAARSGAVAGAGG